MSASHEPRASTFDPAESRLRFSAALFPVFVFICGALSILILTAMENVLDAPTPKNAWAWTAAAIIWGFFLLVDIWFIQLSHQDLCELEKRKREEVEKREKQILTAFAQLMLDGAAALKAMDIGPVDRFERLPDALIQETRKPPLESTLHLHPLDQLMQESERLYTLLRCSSREMPAFFERQQEVFERIIIELLGAIQALYRINEGVAHQFVMLRSTRLRAELLGLVIEAASVWCHGSDERALEFEELLEGCGNQDSLRDILVPFLGDGLLDEDKYGQRPWAKSLVTYVHGSTQENEPKDGDEPEDDNKL